MNPVADLLGIDRGDPRDRLAAELIRADRMLIEDLITIRRSRMTQQEIADLLGITQGAVSQFETGDRDPRLSTLRAYAIALGVTVAHTVNDPGSRQRATIQQALAAREELSGGAQQGHRHEADKRYAERGSRFDGVEVEFGGKTTRILQGQ